MARAAERLLSEFNAQGVANTAWAFALVKQLDWGLFVALARVAERASGFKAQNFANAAWAFVTVKQSGEKLSVLVARVAEECLGDFNVQHLRMSLWVLSRCDIQCRVQKRVTGYLTG